MFLLIPLYEGLSETGVETGKGADMDMFADFSLLMKVRHYTCQSLKAFLLYISMLEI